MQPELGGGQESAEEFRSLGDFGSLQTAASRSARRLRGLAVLVWAAILLAVCGRVLLSPRANSVYPIFAHAGQSWLGGADLYFGERPAGLDRFRYSPAVAALFAPFSLLPDGVGGCLWRLLNAAAFLGGFAWWCVAVLPGWRSLSPGRRAALWLLLVPVAVGSLNNGQSNPLVAGLLLAAVAAVAERRWNVAAACVTAAVLFKGYPLAVGLLLAAVYPRRFAPRLAVALAVGFLLPFLLQRPEYVAGEYGNWLHLLGADDRKDGPISCGYRDLWVLCQAAGIPISRQAYVVLQLLTAAALAVACVAARRAGWPRRRLLAMLSALGTCWMMLCGPATESSTYILLAPVLAWAVVEARTHWGGWARHLPPVSFALLAVSSAACWFPVGKDLHTLGVQPLAALVLTVALVAVYAGRRERAVGAQGA
jgi:hypothetical protein